MTIPATGTAALAPGARLGPYEILAPIGAGGMGEVYRAHDTRLGRDVAIKVIAFDVSSDPDRLRRFEQEARAVAALSHPSILSVYDVGTEAGAPYVVFELLEGESLRQRLAREALTARKAVDWAAQIARGLAAAHDRGIIHRDLKPENLFVTKDGRVKILDFGLAKLLLGEETLAQAEGSSTFSAESEAALLGTIGYMSPEQVRGQAVDARSDIFALGAVLYEMLAARRAFHGNTKADTLTAILKEEPPDLASARVPVSPALERIVKRCLEKAPEERFQSARDLAFALESLSGSAGSGVTPSPRARWTRRLGTALVATLILGAVVLAAFLAGRRSVFVGQQAGQPAQAEIRFQIDLPIGLQPAWAFRLSPDGTRLAFLATDRDGKNALWVRPLNGVDAQPLPGTEGALGQPFWSTDSASIAFFTADKLNRIDLSGGPARMICHAASKLDSFKNGAWNPDGVVIFSTGNEGPLLRVSASGGVATPLTRSGEPSAEQHIHPAFLPDGRHFVFYVWHEDPQRRGIRIGTLDSPETTPLLAADGAAYYAWPGYLLFTRGRALWAQRFDAQQLRLVGEPSVVAESVASGSFSASATGVLAFALRGPLMRQPTWLDRHGRVLGKVGEPHPYVQIALSPDGRQAAAQVADAQRWTHDISLLDLARGLPSRFVFSPAQEGDPVWSPDGRRLAFSSESGGPLAIFVKDLAGGSEKRLLPETAPRAFVEDWSRDGRFLFFGAGFGGRAGLWAVPLSGDRKPFPVVESAFPKDEPQLSPDGRFLAYMSYESGQWDVYVQTFPDPGPRVRVSTEGGVTPRWRGDGRELFYLALDGALMAVDVKTGSSPELGGPRKLFSTPLRAQDLDLYAVTPDGQRFLVLMPATEIALPPITVVLNWTAGLEK